MFFNDAGMKKPAYIFIILFCTIAIIDVAGIFYDSSIIHFVAKPLLMPALLLLLIFSTLIAGNKGLIIAALLFSFLGDVLLLFENKSSLFFIGGLVSFLLTHICYILYFLKIKSAQPSLIRKQPWMAALAAAYTISLVQFLLPSLGDMKIPVIIYAIIIYCMMLCSLQVFLKVNTPANRLFITGALLFTASDSMLAINKFHKPFAAAAVLIMLTYCAAQFCIVQGVIKRK